MNAMHGFSLAEVLESLFLISSTSLALLTQQWHVSQLFNQAHTRMEMQIQADNITEYAIDKVLG